jgi:hypothetical protein
MAIHEVKVKVEKQIDPTACWASLCCAIAESFGLSTPGQAGLKNHFATQSAQSGLTKGQMEPKTALLDKFKITTESEKWACTTDQTELAKNADAVLAKIVETLENKLPLIAGITTADDSKLTPKNGGAGVPLRHAVLVYKCDDTARKIWFMDPARGDNVSFDVGAQEFVQGFNYMTAADLGPNAQANFTIPAVLRTRVYRLIAPTGTT